MVRYALILPNQLVLWVNFQQTFLSQERIYINFILFCIIVDVITIEKTGEYFRLVYDVKCRFTIHRISGEEASVSILFIKYIS